MSTSVHDRDRGHDGPDARAYPALADELELEPAPWYSPLGFDGPLDPAGTLFAFALAVGATVGLVVLVAAAVRVVTGS
jgi:hypothetical protein